MSAHRAYKPTFFDRHGPDGGLRLKAIGKAAAVFGISLFGFGLYGHLTLVTVTACFAAALLVGWAPLALANGAGWTYTRLMVDGASTPYVEQYSYEQSLAMQGRVDDALASFESIIAREPAAVDPRLRAAELYDREKKNFARAAALFREVQRIESATSGQFIFATNRLADLYAAPLGEPGKALVELRRLISLHPNSPAAEHARAALARLKTEARA
jgi:tetratricopeptide (TPR) repeat protein